MLQRGHRKKRPNCVGAVTGVGHEQHLAESWVICLRCACEEKGTSLCDDTAVVHMVQVGLHHMETGVGTWSREAVAVAPRA